MTAIEKSGWEINSHSAFQKNQPTNSIYTLGENAIFFFLFAV
jgi:hypothetical protein